MRHLLLILNVLQWATTSVAGTCFHLAGYTTHGTSCFKLFTTARLWVDAEASCVADGGHLVSIHSLEEQNYVANLASGAGVDIWLGLSGTAPTLTWSDDTGVDYENWSNKEPNNRDFSCGRMARIKSSQWIDVGCTAAVPYVCRAEPTAGTTTSTTVVSSAMTTTPVITTSMTTDPMTTNPMTTNLMTTNLMTSTPVTTTLVTIASMTTTLRTMVSTTPVTMLPAAAPVVPSTHIANQVPGERRAYFTHISNGVAMDNTAVPLSKQVMTSVFGCARKCHHETQCLHYIMNEDGGKYLCETYASLKRPLTAILPNNNYQKII